MKGNMIQVTFFGSGDKAIVNKASWQQYSEHSLSKTLKLITSKTTAFQNGLKHMKNVIAKILQNEALESSSLSNNQRLPKRRFQHLDTDQLQVEGEENDRQLALMMSFDEKTKKWMCKDCPWKGLYQHKAKAHARDCGSRRRLNKKSSKKKFLCSNKDCDKTFASQEDLKKHYRLHHFQSQQGSNCLHCNKTFYVVSH